MLFNSIEFAVFLPIAFIIYWFVIGKSLRVQNLFLLVISYIFYGWWDWRFLILIVFSSFVDYFVSLAVASQQDKLKRKLLMLISLVTNLGLLGYFKYCNFFITSFINAFTLLGQPLQASTINIILPVGISFYTFQTLSYSIDVYNRKLEPTPNLIAFLSFVTYFPQLVAGPIERAANLLPQFHQKRKFQYIEAVNGLQQILWGLFKKIVIADNCAQFANDIFTNYASYHGSTLLLGGVLFAFQIYGDFSGYSDVAIGTSRLFGIKLMRNFAFPYFSRDIAEFWRRWHISLSTWFRDYVYIPLGGSKGNQWFKVRNTFIIFLLSGFWHGANWTFLVWGLINVCYFLPLLLLKQNRNNVDIIAQGKLIPTVRELVQVSVTFFMTVIAWIFFRAENIQHAFSYLNHMFSSSLFSIPDVLPKKILLLLILFLLVEWLQRDKEHALQLSHISIPRPVRWVMYYTIAFMIFWLGGLQQQFIYFQF
ncbi:MBOAT family O-acyltransferase [Pontibacter harenae]|uniref:MBOAT family O-acyltransferase n=1 Tax=Pontibacter harenae TaxID=2894083 RepID=UPI001E2DB4A3|nr:MBOAT family O-acyltransferase [Pontibacter harenae]MCC9165727.1 MBOAT family protein [Pontibacter harenae]